VAGRVVGKLPLIGPVRVATGEVDVEVAADGYEPATRTVQIAAGQYQRVLMRLERRAAEPVAVAPVASEVPPAPLSPPPAPQDTGVNWHRVAKWSVLVPKGVKTSSGTAHIAAAPATPAAWRQKSLRLIDRRSMSARLLSMRNEFHKAAITARDHAAR
jgi:hypothetical protein